ncbi:MAG: hypothetical protein M1120_01100 [Patescibacteria group bacterium]|nr:hypothetical protein [Patescibacteria group bacterium]
MERTTWETVIAIIIGIFLGTMVAVSLWLVKSGKMHLTLPQKSVMVKTNSAPAPTLKTAIPELLVSQPVNNSVVNNKTITVSGRALDFSLVIISQIGGDTPVKADNNGAFKSDISLDEGDNEIAVTALWPDGQTKQQILIIVYQKKT